MTITRREFIGTTAAAVGLAAMSGCSDDNGGATTTVGAASMMDVESTVRRAVELAGGLPEIGPGKTVFIKPNAVYPATTAGITTSNAVLAAVVKIVKERSPQKITVGDRSARGFDTAAVFMQTGMGPTALMAGADEVYAAPPPTTDATAWTLMQPPHYDETWAPAGGILAMKRMLEADYLISVPVLKDHRWAAYSMGMKIFIGGIGDSSRDILHYNLGGDSDRLARDIAILNQLYHPLMTIVDGWTALINGGPQGLPPDAVFTQPHLIIAGHDRLAVDAVGASYLKLALSRTTIAMPDQAQPTLTLPGGPWGLPQLVHGGELGLGVTGPGAVQVSFDGVADAAAIQTLFQTPRANPDAGV